MADESETTMAEAEETSCPVCGQERVPGAFFCESCGYDYLTGALPRGANGSGSVAAEQPVEQAGHSELSIAINQAMEAASPSEKPVSRPVVPVATEGHSELSMAFGEALAAANEDNAQAVAADAAPAVVPSEPKSVKRDEPRKAASWVCEVWIDPEWYRIQQAPDALPSPGEPRIVALHSDQIRIGRLAPGNEPDLNCGADSGVSRKHAMLFTDGSRWFIEDLGSSNGTYIGQVDKSLPTEPISGRYELGQHDRIYLGSWTRIVLRPALRQEAML